MGDTAVDLLAVATFRQRLDDRLAEARFVLDTLTTKMRDGRPALGLFEDAVGTSDAYQEVYLSHLGRITRLVNAIEAARTATDDILRTYGRAEARIQADAHDIAEALAGVGAALTGGGSNG